MRMRMYARHETRCEMRCEVNYCNLMQGGSSIHFHREGKTIIQQLKKSHLKTMKL